MEKARRLVHEELSDEWSTKGLSTQRAEDKVTKVSVHWVQRLLGTTEGF